MRTVGECIEYVFTWLAFPDACKICLSLTGRVWRDQDLFGSVLVDPEYGVVWDLMNDFSLAHRGYRVPESCKCSLDVQVFFNEEKFLEGYKCLAT